MISSLSNLTHKILNCDNDFLVMRDSVQQLYNMFKEIAQVDIENYNSNDIFLPSGKALSSSYAAHCLLEMKRTAVFLRGINKAIDFKLAEKNGKPIRILYAGTGPYATLITPLLPLYSSELVKVDFIEINPISMQAAQRVVEHLGLTAFVEDYHVCDAATFTVAKPYDVVISETMQRCLQYEPQVAIMQNLVAQLPPYAIFIPENITIDAVLTTRGKWNPETCISEGVERISLGCIMEANPMSPDCTPRIVELPIKVELGTRFGLYTTVRVFDEDILEEGDCSLTLPVMLFDSAPLAGETLMFEYIQGEAPHVSCVVLSTGKRISATIGRKSNVHMDLTK
jgi:predicted RNA methylase